MSGHNKTTLTHAIHGRTEPEAIHKLWSQGLIWAGSGEPSTTISFAGPHERREVVPFAIPEIDNALPYRGLRRGELHEFLYDDPLQPNAFPTCLAVALACNAHEHALERGAWNNNQELLRIAWIGKQSWPTPHSLIQTAHKQEDDAFSLLRSILFVDTPTERSTLWAIETSLRSHAIHLIIAACPRLSLTTTKRLSLAAKQFGTTALLIRNAKDRHLPSCASTRWLLTPAPSPYETPLWNLSLLKMRGNTLSSSSWLIGINKHESNLSLRVFPRVVDRCHEEKDTRTQYGT